jgi:hypothetical protein
MTPCRASSRSPSSGHRTNCPANTVPGHSLLPPDAWIRLSAILWLSRRERQMVQGVFDDQDEGNIEPPHSHARQSAIYASSGLLATNLPLLPGRLQLPVGLLTRG